MTEFDKVWISSSNNCWTPLYPAVIIFGVLVLIGVSCIKPVIKRRVIKVASALFLAALATEVSGNAIAEKWRIRHEWTSAHAGSLTEDQRMASIADGANLVFGPFIYGAQALFLFVGVLVAASTITRLSRETAGPVKVVARQRIRPRQGWTKAMKKSRVRR